MLHLLPEYQKKKVINEYRLRLLVVATALILLAVIVFMISTLPSYLYLRTEKNNLIAKKEGFSAIIKAGQAAKTSENGADINKVLSSLKPFPDSLEPLLYIDAISPQVSGVRITGYSFAPSGGNQVAVTLTGIAETRESLSAYTSSLNALFGGVKLPLSSLAKQADIPFEFRFQMDHARAVKALGQAQ